MYQQFLEMQLAIMVWSMMCYAHIMNSNMGW